MRTCLVIVLVLAMARSLFAAPPNELSESLHWTIAGDRREAIVLFPKGPRNLPAPLVFYFHGHGGTMKGAAHNSRIPTLWPEAIVVYMQGLPSPSPVDPKGKKNGWQLAAGRQGDRDLNFVDTVLKTVHEKHAIDDDRIYATGHSNGGRFTYVLWSVRSDIFAAYAPCAAILLASKKLALKPGALLHIGGEKDRIAPFERQQESMAKVREVNGCDATAVDWALGCKLYPPKTREGAPFISFIYPGGHGVPRNSTGLIIKFFKEHPRIHSAQAVR